MLPKEGSVLPKGRTSNHNQMMSYAATISLALRTELGDSHKAIKTIMGWTGASERTAKNWLSGAAGPSGEHLILLAQNSDAVFATVLRLTGRRESLPQKKLTDARNAIAEALEVLVGLTV